jgi:hypothetical protein
MTKGEIKKLIAVHHALDESLGDSDPIDDLTNEELRQEYPVLWAAAEIAGMLPKCWDDYK